MPLLISSTAATSLGRWVLISHLKSSRDVLSPAQVHNYADILPGVIRVLRPGGLYHSGELENAVFFNPDFHQTDSPRIHAPASTQFFQVVNDAVLARGILPSIDQIHIHLWNTGAFNNIQSRNIYIPIGRWHDDPAMQGLGIAFQQILCRFSDSVKPMLLEVGHPQLMPLLVISEMRLTRRMGSLVPTVL